MTLLNDLGIGMGTLRYDGAGLDFSSPYFPQSVKAEYILLDFQNAYYDAGALAAAYGAKGLSFVVSTEDGKEVRRVQDGGDTIEELVKDGESVTITNLLRGYRYELRKID